MSLPELIEIVPPTQPVNAGITVPGSKSITNRALVLAALAAGETTLPGALWSEDTQVMVDCLRQLGFAVTVQPDPAEAGNCTIVVVGLGGTIPRGGTEVAPLELFVGNAGTAARFLAALVCLGRGVYRLHGVPRMHERPQAALFAALRELSYRVDSANDKLPVVIHGTGPRPEPTGCTVSVAESSQFASAILLAGSVGGWKINGLTGTGEAAELPYVAMTEKLVAEFGQQPGRFEVEADSSSGSYFQAADWILRRNAGGESSRVRVNNWPVTRLQIDSDFSTCLDRFAAARAAGGGELVISRRDELGDSIMTAIVLAPLVGVPVRFVHLGRLRVQESDRVLALHDELAKCGARVQLADGGETLVISPQAKLHGAEIETYNDHRLAMCFAILGLHVPGVKIKNPACVKKTFPNFFQKLATPTPNGLGIAIREGHSGRLLPVAELAAE